MILSEIKNKQQQKLLPSYSSGKKKRPLLDNSCSTGQTLDPKVSGSNWPSAVLSQGHIGNEFLKQFPRGQKRGDEI